MNRARHNLVLAAVDVELQPEAGSRNFDEFFRLNLVQTEEFWRKVDGISLYEKQQRDSYLQVVKDLVKGKDLQVVDGDSKVISRDVMHNGRSIRLSCRGDVVVYIKAMDSDSAILWPCLGIEVKRSTFDKKSFYQSLMEFILTADSSLVPFMQVVTDLESGGIAFYFQSDDNGMRRVFYRCFERYSALIAFLSQAVNALPDFVQGKTIESFDTPHRMKFKVQQQVFDNESSTVCDVACLEDLDCFSDVLNEVS
mmetsp:Transcript_54012/g.112850  ORF Transcript_54012/g.112850 Transcript_54012/m.112850 type:complete len:253 (-) Transcript_54012:430-1188(-)